MIVGIDNNTAEQKKLCLYTGSSFPIRYINFKINFNFFNLIDKFLVVGGRSTVTVPM